MVAYYNEVDPYAADWLRNLIGAGHIAPGEVDDRSILDVRPADLVGYTQCHFFAGIGVWSAALRGAGWPDDRPVWTGSCPCQPFSAAGRGEGFADERHLWPSWFHLIGQRRPPVVVGEQVASKAVDPWIDLVQADMEAVGYAFGAVAFPSAGVGAPHIRDRTYFVADALRAGSLPGAHGRVCRGQDGAGPRDGKPQRPGAVGVLAHAEHGGREGGQQDRRGAGSTLPSNPPGRLADAERERLRSEGRAEAGAASAGVQGADGQRERLRSDDRSGGASLDDARRPGPTNGFWRDPDWLFCRDGKWRPVEPGTSPLAHGARSRVGRLRAYGNAINQKAAEAFIRSYDDLRAA